jgi:molybdenum cofactor synthesis domain-containing protein
MHLMEKTELYVQRIKLENANLDELARSVAKELGLEEQRVIVVDVREDAVTLDILQDTVRLDRIISRKNAFIRALGRVNGVTVTPATRLHSEGVLGMVNLEEKDAQDLPRRLEAIQQDLRANIGRRAIVFATGREIINGEIEDTNTPYLMQLLTGAGYRVAQGQVIDDDPDIVIEALRSAADRGFGLVITTGGTGAEDKDFMVEGVQAMDPHAAAPYVVHYEAGKGRHKKDGVRLAVGETGWTTFVALTGPNPEVRRVSRILLQGLAQKWGKARLAGEMAGALRAGLPLKHI